MSMDGMVPSSAGEPRVLPPSQYDLDTYSGRVRHFAEVTSPVRLLTSDADLAAAQQTIADFKGGKEMPTTPWRDVWRASQIVNATVHPHTGEKILLPFRMASFVPTNLVVTIGLLWPNPTVATLMFWQWVNQSVNVGFNWANANKTSQLSTTDTAIAYGLATGTSVGVAVGMSKITQRIKNATTRGRVQMFIPFASVALAGLVNIFLMRSKEVVHGIAVQDQDGRELGKSRQAGVRAVGQTGASRILTSMPALVLCPIALAALTRRAPALKRTGPNIATNLALIAGATMGGLPLAVGLFPQRSCVHPSALEPEFHNLRDATSGQPLQRVFFDKGL